MDDESQRAGASADRTPERRFDFDDLSGVALYVEDFAAAEAYYRRVLGPPGFTHGAGTRGWRIGEAWFTLLRGRSGGPKNVELVFQVRTPAEAERLQAAFIEAGGRGEPPSDQVMYEPLRYCPVTDPFGTTLLIVSPLGGKRP